MVKIEVLGDSDVGKTTLLLRFVNGSRPKDDEVTVAIDRRSKDLELEDAIVPLEVWDTVG